MHPRRRARRLPRSRLVGEHQRARPLDLYTASLQAKSGDFDGAVVFLEGLLEEAPDDPEVLNNLAYLLAEKLDDPNSALPHAQRAAELMPETSSVIDTLGWILFRLDRRGR